MSVFFVLGIFALVATTGFFAAAETSLLAANRLRLRHRAVSGDRRAARALALLERPDAFLTTVLLGNNICAVAAASLTTFWAQRYAGEIGGVVASTVAVTALMVLFAEIIPKSVALGDAEYFALAFAPLVGFWQKIFRPAVWAVNFAGGGVPKWVRARAERLPFVSREELRAILTERRGQSYAEALQRRMIRRIFRFGETTVGEIMVPLADVAAVPKGGRVADVVAAVARTGYSKFPVYEGRPDNVVGVVAAREMLPASPRAPLATYLHAPLFVAAADSLEAVLPTLAGRAVDLAVACGDGGAVVGIVTQEDVVEAVVGEIEDEHGWGSEGLVRYGEGYAADARLALSYFNQHMPVPLPPGNYVTLGGFVTGVLGRVPASGDVIVRPPYRFRVLRADPRTARLIGIEFEESGSAK